MKKNLRTFLIMLLVLVLVGGGAAALLLTQPTEETADEEESSSSQVREPLLDLEPEQVASLQVENAYGAFTLVPLSEEEAQEVTSQESAAESAASSESSVSSGQEACPFFPMIFIENPPTHPNAYLLAIPIFPLATDGHPCAANAMSTFGFSST